MLPVLRSILLVAAAQALPAADGGETAGRVEVGPAATVLAEHEVEVTSGGSPESMARQHAVAVATGLSFVGTLEEMELLAEEGRLVTADRVRAGVPLARRDDTETRSRERTPLWRSL